MTRVINNSLSPAALWSSARIPIMLWAITEDVPKIAPSAVERDADKIATITNNPSRGGMMPSSKA